MIKLNQIMPIDCPSNYKMHIAKYNGNTNPLDDFIENFDYWVGWNTWRSEKLIALPEDMLYRLLIITLKKGLSYSAVYLKY
ncbi:hypothetical protein DW960_08190 [Ruminococcus bromii]|nr:hypothetical protein DW960_08190 [Ruminococcus bromii]